MRRGVRQRQLVNGRAAARSGEWAQHFSNASCGVSCREDSRCLYRKYIPNHVTEYNRWFVEYVHFMFDVDSRSVILFRDAQFPNVAKIS